MPEREPDQEPAAPEKDEEEKLEDLEPSEEETGDVTGGRWWGSPGHEE